MRTHLQAAGFLLLLFVAPAAADAQDVFEPGAWYLMPAAGVALDPDGRAATILAGAVGYGLTPELTVEGEASYIFDRAPDDDEIESELATAGVALLYHFGGRRLRPYLAAGLGVGGLSHELEVPPAEVDATALAVSLGAGASYSVSSRVRVRGDFRYFNYTHGSSSDPNNLVIVDDVPSAWRFVGGLAIRIGA